MSECQKLLVGVRGSVGQADDCLVLHRESITRATRVDFTLSKDARRRPNAINCHAVLSLAKRRAPATIAEILGRLDALDGRVDVVRNVRGHNWAAVRAFRAW